MQSFAGSIVARFRSQQMRESLPYTFGRFETVRRLYGGLLGTLQKAGAVPGVRESNPGAVLSPEPEVLVDALRNDSAYVGLRIEPAALKEILEACREATLRQWRTGRLFRREDVKDGRFADGMPAVIADVLGIDSVPAARAVAAAPSVLRAIELYTGYRPIGFDLRALASFAGDLSDETRRFYGQTIDFHFDVHSYNFVYANYYLSDATADSGAHVMVLGSHTDKPSGWLFGSARRSDGEIGARYPAERVELIEGGPGHGFLQDSSCYHKALAPKEADRLMLHIRYY
jgi:hypothetical protein